MFKKILVLIFLILLGIGGVNASTSFVTLYSHGTSHYFKTTIVRADGTVFKFENDITGVGGASVRFENNNEPYRVIVAVKAWIDYSLFNYGWSYVTTKMLDNDMSDKKIHVTASTYGDTIWNDGNLCLKKALVEQL